MNKIITLVTTLSFIPFRAFAIDTNAPAVNLCQSISMRTLTGIINWASCTLINSVIPLLFTLASVGFMWGVIKYFINPDNEEARKKGKTYMLWGIIALFVMISMWGLVGVLTRTFGIQTLIPQLSQ